MSTPYRKGIRAEYQLSNELKAAGWTVIRAAGSHGPADLVAWSGWRIRIIQVKRVGSIPAMKRAIRDAIAEFEASGVWCGYGHSFEIWLWYKGEWHSLRRHYLYWGASDELAGLLGQTEWPIIKQEVSK